MVGGTVEVFGEQAVVRRLMRMSGKASNMQPFFIEVARYLRNVEQQQFTSEGRTGSGGWAPLKPRTLQRKVARNQNKGTLRATDALRKSLANKTGKGHIEEISQDGISFGTSIPYAHFHQTGAPRANVPQRKVFELSERNKRYIVKKLTAYLLAEGKG